MKNFRTISWMALLGLALMVLTAVSAFAAGTNAGDTISNQATLDYEVGTVVQPQVLSDDDGIPGNGINSTVFVVDNRVDLTMSGGNQTVIPSSTSQVLVFTLENTGNEDQGYDIDLEIGVNGADDDFDMTSVNVYLDNNKDGLLDGGDTAYTVVAGLSNITDVVANDSGGAGTSTIQILVVADTPAVATDGQTASYTLVATTLDAGTNSASTASAGADDTATVQVVLADGAAGAGVNGTNDTAENGQYLATGTYTVQAASIAVTKGVAVISDPINAGVNPKAIPGATVRYTIDVTNSGASDADNVVLTDPIPANTEFLVGTLTEDTTTGVLSYDDGGGTFTYALGAGPSDPNVTDVRVSIPTIAGGGGTAQITFDVVIQ